MAGNDSATAKKTSNQKNLATAPGVTSGKASQLSRPYFTQSVRLHSLHAQHVFDRGFDICADAIFSLSVVLRIVGSDEDARGVEGVIDERLNKVLDDMRSEGIRLEKLAEANGIEFRGVNYSSPRDVEVRITSPRSVRYIGCIRELDGLAAKLDTLWLSGVIPDGDYSANIYTWKRRLVRLSGEIRAIAARAMNAARRKAQANEDDAPASLESIAASGLSDEVDPAATDGITEDTPVMVAPRKKAAARTSKAEAHDALVAQDVGDTANQLPVA